MRTEMNLFTAFIRSTLENEKRNMIRHTRKSILFAMIALIPTVIYGQLDARNVRFTTGETNDSANLSLTVSFGSYKGRGIDLPVNLTYSSASLWRFERLADVNDYNTQWNPQYVKQTITQAIFSENSRAGWKSSLELPIIEWPKADDMYKVDGTPTTSTSNCNYRLPKVFIHMPDGSTHEFRKSDTPNLATDGFDQNGQFYAVDGSRMRYDSTDADTGTLYLPDGTRYELDAGNGAIIDRNGNTATYSASTRQWTDTLGRTLDNPIPANPVADTTTHCVLPGLSGVSPSGHQTYDLKWKHLGDVLTPVGGSTPALNYVASDYLPYPDYAPTSSNSWNYPQARPSPSPRLFQSASNYDVDGNPSLAPTIALGQGQGETDVFNPVVLSEIDLPDGTKYTFTYNVYGEITKIVYPTNAYELFEYERAADNFDTMTREPYDQAHRRLKSRKLSADGSGSDEVEWRYSDSAGGYYRVTSIIAPDNTRTEIVTIDYNMSLAKLSYQDATNGSVVEKRQYSTSSNGLGGSLLRRELTKYDQSSNSFTWSHRCNNQTDYDTPVTANRNPRPVKHTTVLFEGSGSALAQTTTYSYDTTYQYSTGLNKTQENTYNFAVISNASPGYTAQNAGIDDISTGTLAGYTVTSYQNGSGYLSRNILGRPTQVITYDASSNPKAKSEISYDDSSHTETSAGTMPTAATGSWTDPSTEFGTIRGLPTIVKNYYDISNSYYIQTENFYDQFGSLRKTKDGRGNYTWTAYEDTYAFAFPTSVTTPIPDSSGIYGSSSALTTSSTYDYQTGLPVAITDPNGLQTKFEYIDDLLRPTKVYYYYSGSQVGGAIETSYGAGTDASSRWIKVQTQIDSSNWKESYKYYDGIGRTVYTQTVDDLLDDIFAITCYDNMGRVSKSSNPVRASSAPTCSSSLDWTTPTYDDLGRATSVTSPDDAHVDTTYSLATSGSQIGTVVQVADQAGKLRRSITNGLGQLIRVDEPNSSNALGSIDSPNQDTNYYYDTLNNLTGVTQGSQTRSFTYDALSRLKEATNPESGTIKYTYDEDNNLKTRWDARGIKTIYDYDALNRIWKRCYKSIGTSSLGYTTCADATSHGETAESNTPDVTMYYDIVTNSKGKLNKVSSSVSATEYTGFDILGHITQSRQTTDSVTYGNGSTDSLMTYSYDLAGDLIEQQYPSGRKVRNTFDTDGNLAKVDSKKNSSAGYYYNYANNFKYSAAGAVTSMELGNGRWESTTFNNRLQPTQITLGTAVNAYDLLKLNYTYSTSGNHDNNGNVLTQTITVPSLSDAFNQSYSYDSLNRLASATETYNGTQNWKQEFSYDRYGNRNFVTGSGHTDTLGSCTTMCNPTISTTTNRITSSGFSYDSSGNTSTDPSGQSFTYDGENKQVLVTNGGNTVGQYWYDGDGKRVKKYVPETGESTVFVYDASGKEIAEYSTVVANSTNAKVNYLTSDHLGTPRINTDQNGAVLARHDYMPFGEEIGNIGGRNNGGDTVRKQFTGYERDEETELDFGQARYLDPQLGRFSTPDDFLNDTHAIDPSSWNLFVYVRNSPLRYSDPSGDEIYDSNLTEDERTKLIEDWKKKTGYKNIYFDSNHKLVIDAKAGFEGGSKTARTNLLDAVNSTDKRFNLESVDSTKVAFAEVNAGAVTTDTATGKQIGPTVYKVEVDFKDFDRFKGGSDKSAIEAFSVGIAVLHEVDHKLYKEIDDKPNSNNDPGPVENTYINPIRRELGLPERVYYKAKNTSEALKSFFPGGGQELGFRLNGKDRVVRWQKDQVGGKVE